jgi:maltooligosyltrehalose synthase
VAFARRLGRETVIGLAPRFVARLRLSGPPLGSPVWAGTWLAVPETWTPRAYRNVLTGEEVAVTTQDGGPGLMLEAVLATLPVALLEATDAQRIDDAAGTGQS